MQFYRERTESKTVEVPFLALCMLSIWIRLKEIQICSLTMRELCCSTILSSSVNASAADRKASHRKLTWNCLFSGRLSRSCCDQNKQFPISSSIREFPSMSSFSKVTIKASRPHERFTAVQGIVDLKGSYLSVSTFNRAYNMSRPNLEW